MKTNKEEQLKTLERFVKLPKLGGTVASQHFLVLRQKFPLEFVLFMKRHRAARPPANDIVDSCLSSGINEVNKLYSQLHDYMLRTDKKAGDSSIDRVVEKLEYLLEKQAREN